MIIIAEGGLDFCFLLLLQNSDYNHISILRFLLSKRHPRVAPFLQQQITLSMTVFNLFFPALLFCLWAAVMLKQDVFFSQLVSVKIYFTSFHYTTFTLILS